MTVTPETLTVSPTTEERKVIVIDRSNGWADGVLTKATVTHESLDATILQNDSNTGRAEVSVNIRPSTAEELKLVDRSIVLFFENAGDESVKVPVVLKK